LNEGEFFLTVIKIVVTLVFILSLAYLSIRFGLSKIYTPSGQTSYMKIIEQLYLGPKTLLILVQVGEEYFLLTSSNGQIGGMKNLAGRPETLKYNLSDDERKNQPLAYSRLLGNTLLKRFFTKKAS
jgi:flagellar protein FliO/FliZ